MSKSTPRTLRELSQELCNKNEVESEEAHIEERQEGLVDEGIDMSGKSKFICWRGGQQQKPFRKVEGFCQHNFSNVMR